MLKKILYLFILIVLIGCKEKLTKVVEYYDNGSIKETYYIDKDSIKHGESIEYFPNGRVGLTTKYTNGKIKDTIFYYRDNNSIRMKEFFLTNDNVYYEDFYPNGSIRQKGIFNNKRQRIGLWKNYNKEGNHHFTKEYKIIDGKVHTNQMWVTLPTGDTLTEGVSIQYHFDKNKLQLTDSIYAFFQTEVSAFDEEDKEKTTVSVVLPKDYTQANFVSDFSNQPKDPDEKDGIPIIKIKNLEEHPNPKAVLQKPIDTTDYKKTVVFYWKPKRTGKDTIRGYFEEEVSLIDKNKPIIFDKNKDSIMTAYVKEIYFEFAVEVTKD